MSRLTFREPDITLYEGGFAGHDLLERKATGDALSDLVDRIAEPMVIALDAGWESGNIFFLTCWVGEHLKREGNDARNPHPNRTRKRTHEQSMGLLHSHLKQSMGVFSLNY